VFGRALARDVGMMPGVGAIDARSTRCWIFARHSRTDWNPTNLWRTRNAWPLVILPF